MPWEIVNADVEILAVHAALLPTNEVLFFGGSEHNSSQNAAGGAQLDNSRLLSVDALDATPTTIGSPDTDVFCSGHSFLGDGRLLVSGGTQIDGWGGQPGDGHAHGLDFGGARGTWIYGARARTWVRVRDLNFEPGETAGGGRWYPTLVTLASGEVFCVSGHPHKSDTRHHNDTQERYSAASDGWTHLTAELLDPGTGPSNRLYPRYHLLPDGTLFFTTPYNGDCRRFDATTGTTIGATIGAPGGGRYNSSWDFPAVLLPLLPGDAYRPLVLIAGTDSPRIIDLDAASPAWEDTVGRTGAADGKDRRFSMMVLLPTGQVFLTGGIDGSTSDSDAVMEAELYTPGIDWAGSGQHRTPASWSACAECSWETLEAADVIRNYHSTALLLPDGRVLTAGSSKNAAPGNPATFAERRVEVYSPDYVAAPNRVVIADAPDSAGYGQTFQVECPDADRVARVALTRCGSSTHAFDADQRYVGLVFDQVEDTTLQVTSPPHGAVAPPGQYLLWLIDTDGNPCQRAHFIRVCSQGIDLIMDRSTVSTHEITALGLPAVIPNAIYVVLRNYLPHEAGSPLVPPTLEFRRPDGSEVPGLTEVLNQTLYEDPSVPPDTAQSITFVFHLQWTSQQAFTDLPDPPGEQAISVVARHQGNSESGSMRLTVAPNPYMRDGQVHWLSTDLRVFTMRRGDVLGTIPHGNADGDQLTFIQDLLAHFNSTTTDEFHPWFDLDDDPDDSALELSAGPPSNPIFNFAVARVRYRAPVGIDADQVRAFFRMFRTAATGFAYLGDAYPRTEDGPDAAPLLGVRGGEVLTIPYFAEEREADMRTQTDLTNRQTLAGSGSAERSVYFGCWLDFNQTSAHFPLNPPHDGSGGAFTSGLLSMQDLVRNHHCCLVAEVHYDQDLIPGGATPGSHENLAQRNLVVVDSDNPGNAAAHTVQTTFELLAGTGGGKAGDRWKERFLPGVGAGNEKLARLRPDELLIQWGDLPRDSRVSIFAPSIDAELVARAVGRWTGAHTFQARDQELLCNVGGATYLPIPGPLDQDIAALMTVQLPPTVAAGQVFRMTLHQVSGGSRRRVIGSFQVTVKAGQPGEILPVHLDRLAVYRSIGQAIPAGDRWRPIWDRMLVQLADNVRGLGGNPDLVAASPHGHLVPVDPDRPDGEPGDDDPLRPWDPDGDPRGVVEVIGTVTRLIYDCHGRLRAVELCTCKGPVRLPVCGPQLEKLALSSRRFSIPLTVWARRLGRGRLEIQGAALG